MDYEQIANSEAEQFDQLADEINAVADNFYFQTMGESAIVQWERIFGIVPNPQSETLDFRRARLLNRISTKPPFTLTFLSQKLDELIGVGLWTINMDYANYTLYIESSAKNQAYAQEVAYTIGKIKPAHIVFINTPYTASAIKVSERIDKSEIDYNYRLSYWGLGLLPFASEGEEGVVKMPTTPSVTSALLDDITAFTSSDIVSARLNGETVIEEITKQQDGNVLTVSYTVTPESVEQINKIELLDAQNTALTSIDVYVPVTTTTSLKHTITTKEGV